MIIVAIDETNFERTSEIIDGLDSKKCMVKIGSVAFNSMGHEIIKYAAKKDMLDKSKLSYKISKKRSLQIWKKQFFKFLKKLN